MVHRSIGSLEFRFRWLPFEADTIIALINIRVREEEGRFDTFGLDIYRFRILFSSNSMSEINEAIERIRNNPNSGATCAVRDKERILSHWLAVGKPSRWLSRVRKYRNVAVQLFEGTKGKAGEWRRPKYRRNRCSPIVCMNVNGSSIFPLFFASSLTFSLRCFLPAAFTTPLLPTHIWEHLSHLAYAFPPCFYRILMESLKKVNLRFCSDISKVSIFCRSFEKKKTDHRDFVSWNNFLSIFVRWIRIFLIFNLIKCYPSIFHP